MNANALHITSQDQPCLSSWPQGQAGWGRPASQNWGRPNPLTALAAGFAPISLKHMDRVALLNRTDTKFILTSEQLLSALAAIQMDYWMLEVAGKRLQHYRTLYFDTPDFALYTMHVNGRADRYKVRSREYADSSLSFLEVKHKNNKGRTIKQRIATARPVGQITPETGSWLDGVFPYDSQALEPLLWNTFTRLTLASKQYCERVTLDVDLTFYTRDNRVNLAGIVIAEVKTDSTNQTSPFLEQMYAQRIHPHGFSKYCMGVSMLYDQVKKNTLKPRLRLIEKMNITGEMPVSSQ